MVVNMSHMYFSHYTIIKFVSFDLIHYVINLNVMSFSKFFSDSIEFIVCLNNKTIISYHFKKNKLIQI